MGAVRRTLRPPISSLSAHRVTQFMAWRYPILSRSTCYLLIVMAYATECQFATRAAHGKNVDFARQILPILSDKCFVCHGPDVHDPDQLRLDSFESATADRGGYRAINVASPDESELLRRVVSDDEPMPPADAEKQLSAKERELLAQWVKEGGAYSQHWAFVPPRQEELPSVDRDDVTTRQAIDALVSEQLKAQGIDFAPVADPSILARRVALTLTGLPPEPEVLAEYLSNPDDDAYERLVNHLLQSPRFGEHQARYWLDAVRYGDTHGLHLDNRRGIYPYRDWVVRALNANLPWDQFITWQLAGDLLPNSSLAQKVATGFVRMNPTTSEGGVIAEEFQAKNNFDRTETLGTVLLGMTLTCARCHTHKYDPIAQTEYYQLMAFFNSTAEHSLDGNKYDYGPVIKAPNSYDAWEEWQAAEADRQQLLRRADEWLSHEGSQEATARWAEATVPERVDLLADKTLGSASLQEEAAALRERMTSLTESGTTTLVAQELETPRPTHLLNRGEYNQPVGDPLEPNVIRVMGAFSEDSPRNRRGLAEWLTSDHHPLVTRVLVNRIWQQVFGHGLVRTPENFGLQGEQPTHPELLDWLAVDFRTSGWNYKELLRAMVTSRTFRQSSAFRADMEDPENRLWGRGPRYRMDAEMLRDVALWSSRLLDPHMGGEGVKPYQPNGMWKAMAHPASNTKEYVRDKGQLLYRRSLYIYWKRTSPHPMMTLFDAPDRESSCVRRSRTSTPLQSLGLFNETQRIEMGRKLAARLIRFSDDDETRLHHVFSLLACRPPDGRESAACGQLVKTLRNRYTEHEDDASKVLSIGDAPADPDLSSAEHAAWTQLAVTLLASDMAILVY